MNIIKSSLLSGIALIALHLSTATLAATTENSKLIQAVSSEHRSAKNKARDEYRHPVATLQFFGLQPTMTVVEMVPGGGWYTEILAPILKGKGKLYGAHYPDTGKDDYYSNSRAKLVAKLASDEIFSEVELTNFIPRKASVIAPENSADMVLTFRNLHNWGEEGIAQFYKDAYKALKPNGILGVVEHRMPANMNFAENARSGYVPQALAIKLAEQAGFTLQATSEINANPKDNADHPKGVWTLPPVLRLGEQDKEKYMAIGESDRMTLKFVKAPVKL
jgi:predicted methyltransferase